MSDLTILVLAGGRGERLLPLTKTLPKPLIKINNKEILSYLLDSFSNFHYKQVLILTGYKSKLIENFISLKYNKLNIKTKFTGVKSDISTRIKKAYNQLSNNILICYGDTLADLDLNKLIKFYKKKKLKTILTTYQHKSSFGIIKLKKNKIVKSFIEKPKLDFYINIGYILIQKKYLKNIKNFKNFESFLKQLISKNKVFSFVHKGKHITVNTIYELEKAKKNLKK